MERPEQASKNPLPPENPNKARLLHLVRRRPSGFAHIKQAWRRHWARYIIVYGYFVPGASSTPFMVFGTGKRLPPPRWRKRASSTQPFMVVGVAKALDIWRKPASFTNPSIGFSTLRETTPRRIPPSISGGCEPPPRGFSTCFACQRKPSRHVLAHPLQGAAAHLALPTAERVVSRQSSLVFRLGPAASLAVS